MASIIIASSTGSGGIVQTADASGVLQLQSNGTVALNINTSAQVAIGGTSSASGYYLTVRNSGIYVNEDNANTKVITIRSDFAGVGPAINVTTADPLLFQTNNTERMRVNAGAPILCLAGGSTTATGTGIAFPATQSASTDANTLDDYEEGTFTPTYVGATNPTVTYSTQVGRYTKIGNVVYYFIRLDTTAVSGGSGALNITGLPFSVLNDNTVPGAYIGYKVNWTTNGPDFGRSNSVTIELYRSTGTAEAAITVANLGTSTGFIIGGMYRVA